MSRAGMSSVQRDLRALSALARRLAPGGALDAAVHAVGARLAAARAAGAQVHVTAVGKSSLVARRCAATLRSISLRSAFTHPAEWAHGVRRGRGAF